MDAKSYVFGKIMALNTLLERTKELCTCDDEPYSCDKDCENCVDFTIDYSSIKCVVDEIKGVQKQEFEVRKDIKEFLKTHKTEELIKIVAEEIQEKDK